MHLFANVKLLYVYALQKQKNSLHLTKLTNILIFLFTTKHVHNVPSIFHTQTTAEADCKEC